MDESDDGVSERGSEERDGGVRGEVRRGMMV